MTLKDLFESVSDTQEVLLYGDGIETSVETDAETLTNILNEEVKQMYVSDIAAEGNFLKVWIEEVSDGK